MMVTKFFEGFT